MQLMVAKDSLGDLCFNTILNVKDMGFTVYSDCNLLLSGRKKARGFLTTIKYLLVFYCFIVGRDLGIFYRLNYPDLLMLRMLLLLLDYLGLMRMLLLELGERLLII